ncbi:MAG: lysine N(6)-hydroxylase/L-ornithine N(5)-oxygenase family protein [Spirulina sp. SIO3F2]|nr:lysine N(6)-hydroxylase/L-ornithine N(5)-oxygenase family protein [Spirulina sp. SIO3F2]
MVSGKTAPANGTVDKIDIAIIGAGPQALTLVTHLLQKKKSMRQRFVVLDPAGDWLQQWQHQFAAYGIPHLRSPAVHHPDPNPYALRAFAESRPTELFPPYALPGTQLFHDFCQAVVRRWGLQERVMQAQVQQIELVHQHGWQRFRLGLADGRVLTAKRVVLAIAGGKPNMPAWVQSVPSNYPSERLLHSHQVDLRDLPQLTGETILIVGSGLTSGHLALGAIARGAKVIMMARRTFYEKLFDAEPGWLGPKYLKGFHAEPDWDTRWQMIQTARNGGSFTPAVFTQLRRWERNGKLSFYEQCEVQSAAWQENVWKVTCNQAGAHHCIAQQPIDRIWLATGSTLDVNHWPLLDNIRALHPVPLVNGSPVLDAQLRWAGCNLFIMGGAAALQLGPVARNLFGARLASERIVPALIKNFIHELGHGSLRQLNLA